MEKQYFGVYQGVVTNIQDEEKRGRIKCKIPDVLKDKESAWCDPMVTVAYDYCGDFCIPLVNEMVWIMFIAGDPNRPVYFGGWWQKNRSPIGETYTGLDDLRIINYANCTIIMKKDIITINIGEGTGDLEIKDGKVTVYGDLTVTGHISSASHSTGPVKCTSVDCSGGVSAGSVSAGSVTASGVSLKNHTHGGVESGGSNTLPPN